MEEYSPSPLTFRDLYSILILTASLVAGLICNYCIADTSFIHGNEHSQSNNDRGLPIRVSIPEEDDTSDTISSDESLLTSEHRKPSHDNNNHDDRDRTYVLRPRIFIWIRQILFGVVILSYLVLCLMTLESVSFDAMIVNDFDYPSVIICITLSISILIDGLNNIYSVKSKSLWLFVYCLTAPYFAYESVPFSSWRFVAYFMGIISTAFDILFAPTILQYNQPTVEFTCDLFEYISFSYLNRILINPMQHKMMEFEDIPGIVDSDTSACCWNSAVSSKRKYIGLRLLSVVFWDWLHQGIFQFIGMVSGYVAPIALQIILSYVQNGNLQQQSTILPFMIDVRVAVMMLIAGPFTKSICEGQNYLRAQRTCMRVRSTLITIIYNKLLTVDLTAYDEGPGKINNLISVDIRSIEDIARYSHWLWSLCGDIIISMILLDIILGVAAIWGVAVIIFTVLSGFILTSLLNKYQDSLLTDKDKRMSIVNELLNGIRIIKLFAWEDNFFAKLSGSRRKEVQSLKYWAYTNAASKLIWSLTPVAVSCTAFLAHVYIYGHALDAPTGYAALTLFNALRLPLRVFPEIINLVISSKLSLERIEVFLSTPDARGLEKQFGNTKGLDIVINLERASFSWRPAKDLKNKKGKSDSTNMGQRLVRFLRSHLMSPLNLLFKAASQPKYQNVSTNEENDLDLELSNYDKTQSRSVEIENPLVHDKSSVDTSNRSSYESTATVLAKITATMPKGSLILVAGPTGCGKFT